MNHNFSIGPNRSLIQTRLQRTTCSVRHFIAPRRPICAASCAVMPAEGRQHLLIEKHVQYIVKISQVAPPDSVSYTGVNVVAALGSLQL